MRRNWAATVLVVSVSVLCAPAHAGSARPPSQSSAFSPGSLAMTLQFVTPLAAPSPCDMQYLPQLPTPKVGGRFLGRVGNKDGMSSVGKLLLARERTRVFGNIGRLQIGGTAVRRVRPGQLARPTEAYNGQDLHVRAGVSYKLSPHIGLTSELLYIRPATQSLYVRRARGPIQVGVGTRVTNSLVSLLFSAGVGMAEWGGSPQPGAFILLGPGV